MEGMDPIDRLVEVEWIPSELVRDLMKLFAVRIGIIGRRFSGLEGRVCSSGENAVQPCLLVFMSRGGEGGARKLLGVQAIGWFLRRICAYG